jgi:DnaJ-class molecular chaperone
VLSDGDKRKVYDMHGEEGLKNGFGGGGGGAHFRDGMDIFEEVRAAAAARCRSQLCEQMMRVAGANEEAARRMLAP